ncbi:MAG TPA: hypothetical protein VMV69_09740 [Pirellulales bacterium]|nr:hypothetical protein [Pirellulales bacterium]
MWLRIASVLALADRLQADDKNQGDHDLLIAQILFREAEAPLESKRSEPKK